MENREINMMSKVLCIISSVLKKWIIIIFIGCLSGILLDVYKTMTYTPLYSAKAVVALLDGDEKGTDYDSTVKGNVSLSYLMNSQYLKNMVVDSLDIEEFNGSVSSYVTTDTNFINIEVTSTSQKDAYFLLNELIDVYQKTSKTMSFGYNITLVDQITFTNAPLNYNQHSHNYFKGALVSMIICIAILSCMNYFKDNIKSEKEVNDKLDVKLFAKIPKERKQYQRFKNRKKAILVNHFRTGFAYVEAMNKLASKVEDNYKKYGYKTILMTSSLENEGKSSVAVNLALTLAKNKYKVLLIDGDLRKPSIHKIFEYQPQHNFTEILDQSLEYHECITHLTKEKIDVIFSNVSHKSQELLSQFDFDSFFNQLKNEYDYIIVDSAPSRYIADTSMFASYCDSTYIVAKQNDATCKVINDTIYHLTNTSAHIVGTIYNASVYNPLRSHSLYGYRYGYRYGYYGYNKDRRG